MNPLSYAVVFTVLAVVIGSFPLFRWLLASGYQAKIGRYSNEFVGGAPSAKRASALKNLTLGIVFHMGMQYWNPTFKLMVTQYCFRGEVLNATLEELTIFALIPAIMVYNVAVSFFSPKRIVRWYCSLFFVFYLLVAVYLAYYDMYVFTTKLEDGMADAKKKLSPDLRRDHGDSLAQMETDPLHDFIMKAAFVGTDVRTNLLTVMTWSFFTLYMKPSKKKNRRSSTNSPANSQKDKTVGTHDDYIMISSQFFICKFSISIST